MRNYWRVQNSAGELVWATASTDANGLNDLVFFTNLLQVLSLEQGESPLFANVGIAAQQSILQQVWPDFSVAQTQQLFSPYFASLTISKVQNPVPDEPTYDIFVIAHSGANLNVNLVPTTGVLATPQGQPITLGGVEIQV
jgi:hypothetical protein